ncbi:MAG: sigma-70 family RNA polymerase sigma factor [Bacteroidetes bacterium]|nr:MAG: sigma-70 family RNA polymerase sigma factor [Bacteroidota bacterium]
MSDIETDILLIENAKADIKFFGLLYKKYQKTIFLYVHKQLLDKDLAKDITADCFVKAMNNLDKYEHRNLPFSAWLYRIAINEINSYFKKHKKLKIFSLEDIVLENFSDWSETDCEDQKKVEKLESALKKLDNNDQNLLNMAFQDNKTYKEIGQIYHTTEQNIKVKMFRIREKLKNWMN